ncbi:MAG TPA: putative quinol monooxygenase [Pseudonocardiaceae bacterium]|nr:putative quinol monooxygenase [Pseudonocardiaceae bacterium]
MILIVVKFTVHPEYADEWLDRVRDFTEGVRAEPGNLFFEWSRSTETPNQYVLVEGFESAAAGEAHVNTDHFKTAMAWMPDVIATKPDIINADIPNTGWDKMGELTPTRS